ncbi:MAG: polysaccharide biosynthesis/export family protein [Alphaproteobacteria bacterium]|nr:polysaccharide biosynthesis/export family protein [Alphaproteobacteria bacterium]MBV9860780.1 polysaccharide biosynthesis/export family protein [Alphaproteobacteria bacterium]
MWKKPLEAAAFFTLLSLLLGGPASGMSPSAGYRLGAEDKIRIRVYEWRPSIGEVHEWSALNGEFAVGPSGEVSLPLIGSVPAAGMTPEDFARSVSASLQTAVGLAKPPEASVEITQYRPFYILGDVEHPGAYPFRPGMTVLQALSIAGGLYRASDPGLLSFRRSALADIGELRALQLDYARLLAHRARLRAELDGTSKIEYPAELSRDGSDAAARFAQSEQVAFDARREALRTQTEAFIRLRDLSNREIASLQAKITNADQELTMLRNELTNVASLVSRGLVVAPREFSLRQNELEMQARRLDLDSAMLKARQDVETANQRILDLTYQAHKETLADLQQTNAEFTRVAANLRSRQDLVHQDEAAEPELIAATAGEESAPAFSIVHREGDVSRETEAAETTSVMPGDTIKVWRKSDASLANSGSNSPLSAAPGSVNESGL